MTDETSEAGRLFAKKFDIKVASGDDLVIVTCPTCENTRLFKADQLLRGLNATCSRCGTHFQTLPGSAEAITSFKIVVQHGTEHAEFEVTQRRDGGWVFLDADEKSILDVLDHDSDRAIAVIVGSMIENRLKRAMLAKMRRDKKIETRLFQASGPLGSFSAKIDLAALIGLISLEAYNDFMVLKDIRNLFAHNLSIRDFRSQQIKDKAANFKLIDEFVAETVPEDGEDGQVRFVNFGRNSKPAIFTKNAEIRKKHAKERYLMTAQLITVRFAPCDLPKYPWPLF